MLAELKVAKQYFKEDFLAGLGLTLVVLPLALGIAIASGVPPMAGVLSAIVGGGFTSVIRSSQVTINGPSAGLIVVLVVGVVTIGEGDPVEGFQGILAASIIAGCIQMLLGLLKLGSIGDMVPSAVIHGVLAAVGIIIFSSQVHVALGVEYNFITSLDSLKEIPHSLQKANPFVVIITLLSILALYLHHKLKDRFKYIFPAPIWILLLTVPVVYLFKSFNSQDISFLGHSYYLGPEYLVQIPNDILEGIVFPDFQKINTLNFWSIVFSIATIASIDTLISAKGVDKLDSLRRQTNLSRELFAVGLSSVLAGFIGGLPIITAIPVYNGAKTKWSSFYFGILLLLSVILLVPIIQKIPLAALAVLLIYTAYKLAHPKVLIAAFRKGDDQFIIFLMTLLAAFVQGLLFGIIIGILTTLFIHYVKSNLESKQFFYYLFHPDIETERANKGKDFYIKIKGVLNFINIPMLKKALRKAAVESQIIMDLSNTRLIDYTVLEYLHDEAPRWDIPNVKFELVGVDAHDASSRHPNALRVLPDNKKPQLTQRQKSLKRLAIRNNGEFSPEIRWDLERFKDFQFFHTRKIEYCFNTAKGHYKIFFDWQTCDVTFAEGVLFSNQERHTSVQLLDLPFKAPLFVLQREELFDKIGAKLSLKEPDINFSEYEEFSNKFLLKGPKEDQIRRFFTTPLIHYLEENSIYHIESNGYRILIFKEMRFASPTSIAYMHTFAKGLADLLLKDWEEQNGMT